MGCVRFGGLKYPALALLGTLFVFPGTVGADGELEGPPLLEKRSIPWPKGNYHHFSKNQDLAELLNDFCSAQGFSVIVSPKIKETVNGRFNDIAPEQFWRDMVNAYGLIWFFDGSILYVYESNQIQTHVWSMTVDEMNTLCRVIDELGIASSHFSIRRLERAGILVISGPPRLIAVIGELSQKIVIERIDEVSDVRIFPLKYAWAYNMSITSKDGNIMIPGVAAMLQQLLVSKQQGSEGAAVPVFSLSSSDKTKAQPHKELLEGRVSGTKPSSSSTSDAAVSHADTAEAVGGQNVHVEDTLISFDARLNAVIIKGKKQNMPFFERIIQELDVPCRVIRIDVAIVDIDQKAAQEFGTDLLKIYDKPGKRTFSFSPKGEFKDATSLASNLRLPLNSVFKKFNVETYLQALEESGNAQTLARPSVLTIDNIGATIDRSNTFYVKVSGTKTEGLYDVSASTKLRVVPHIIPDEFNGAGQAKIKLFVEVADGSVSQKTSINDGTPTTDSNMINTQAVLYEGQSLVIGGYFHETHSTAEAGFPILRHIPILGHLFKSQESKKEVRERIYVITPRIVDIDGDPDADTRRFFQKGHLRGVATLSSNAFALTEEPNSPEKEWLFAPKEKSAVPSSDEAPRPPKRRRVRRW